MGILDGRVALITGTARGQGRAAARAFTREGAKVVGCDVLEAENVETVERVREHGGEITGFAPVDLGDPEQAQRWVDDAVACYGGVDIVYNNAGTARFGPMPDVSVEDWRFTMRNELDLVFYVTKFAWPHLVARGGGVIINIASTAGMMGVKSDPMVPHNATKGAVIGMTRQFAVEGAAVGIRAVAISPGPIATKATEALWTTDNPIVHRTLLERWGTPEEVVELAAFLASDRASYITGTNYEVSGGMSAW